MECHTSQRLMPRANGYAQDYISRLCREKKFVAFKSGKVGRRTVSLETFDMHEVQPGCGREAAQMYASTNPSHISEPPTEPVIKRLSPKSATSLGAATNLKDTFVQTLQRITRTNRLEVPIKHFRMA